MAREHVFVSYSHKDSEWKDRLVTQINAAQSKKVISWDDTKIHVGNDWLSELYDIIDKASVAILLVSAEFLTSKFINTHEIPRLLQRHISGGLQLIPLIVKPCPWKQIDWLSRMQVSPWEGKPLSLFEENEAEAHLALIAEKIATSTKRNKMSYLPPIGDMVTRSVSYNPPRFLGLKLDSKNPLCMHFIFDLGDEPEINVILHTEAKKLTEYFLTCLAIPDDDIWVNLSPAENDRVMSKALARTKMGKDLLTQDYVLKQFNASLMYPESNTGRIYWDFIYRKLLKTYGTTEKPVNTFNKVWIVPELAKVSQFGGLALITDEKLDVLMEEDYKVLNKQIADELSNIPVSEVKKGSSIASNAFSECLLAELKKEVNEGCHFSTTRKIYHSLILARWYKQVAKDSLVSKCYADKSHLTDELEDTSKFSTEIFDKYVEAMSKGVFNYIREDIDSESDEMIPRKYFSGGILVSAIKERLEISEKGENIQLSKLLGSDHKCYLVKVTLEPDFGNGRDGPRGPRGTDSVAGLDFSRTKVDVTKYADDFDINLKNDLVESLFSKDFKGFKFYIDDIFPLCSIDELIDTDGV